MSEDTIPSNTQNLTDPKKVLENGARSDPITPNGSPEADLDPKTKEGFQRLVAKREAEAKAETERAQKAEAELAKFREERRQQKLSELDETERLRVQNQELVGNNAKLEMRQFASRELASRNIKPTDPIYEIVSESPWLVPFVRRSLGDEPSWAEVIQAVQDRLPAYLDQLASKNGETPGTTTPSSPSGAENANGQRPPQGDPERQPGDTTQKRIWTRKEIAALSDPDYLKHRADIKLADKEGRIVSG